MENIEKRILGKSGIQVPVVSVGLWAIGGDAWGPTDDRQSLNVIDAALDLGVNFFDTADVYGQGHSEELLGQAMKGRRDRFIVATKIGWRGFNDGLGCSAYNTPEKLVAGVETNLRRLGTDYVDLIQYHVDFRESSMEAVVAGFQKLQDDGKVRAYGLSTSDFEYLKAFNQDGKASTLQIDYSILNRTPEVDILPYCQEQNLGVLVRGPLAMGILAGKFTPESKFPEGDFRRRWHENKEEHQVFLQDLQKVDRLRSLTDVRSLVQLALQFVTTHPAVTCTIPGAKSTKQLEENIAAASLPPLTESALAEIEKITPKGSGRKIWPA
ncbi:MAG: aldo/keto reductase [Anaerolineales bacterium]|jgi:aryl-alcohol dehydrogenase-like predicted oxidoreductase